MKYASFIAYAKKYRFHFNAQRFLQDIQYRSVIFHQIGYRYRSYCERHGLPSDYIDLAFEVQAYEQRSGVSVSVD